MPSLSTNKPTIAVVDYGMGNLRSVAQALRHAADHEAAHILVTDQPEQVLQADRIVLPGQGAMPDCMRKLRESKLLEAVLEAARNKPLLGICVGMQMLLDASEEGATHSNPNALTPSLGLVGGQVKRFRLQNQLQEDGSRFKVPQMGWNQVIQTNPHILWQNIPDHAWFYFVHSYYVDLRDNAHSAGETIYGKPFTSVIIKDNIFATQFHPEKSADAGLQLYRNFLQWRP